MTGDDATPVREWLRVGPDGPPWSLDHDALVDGASDEPIVVDVDGEDPLFIMYTSGTTGLPKGALHTHDSVEWAVLTVLATADVRFLDRYLICLPLFHVGALNPLTVTIYRGGTVILMRQFDPERIWTDLPRRAGDDHPRRPGDVELHAADLPTRRAPAVAAALDHERCGAGAAVADRGVRQASAWRSTRCTGSPRRADRPA